MSVRVMSLVWDKFPEGGSEMLVMLAMADWCNDEGLSLHPSNDAVAKKCRISRVQAQRVLRSLTEAGWLEVIGNQFGGAPGTTKKYRLSIEKLKGYQNDTGITGDTGIANDTGITQVLRRVSPSAETGITGDTQTIIEPSINTNTRFSFKTAISKLGVPADLVADWMLVRKTKKATNTKTSLETFTREVAKAGWTYEQAVRHCVENDWKGFRADWVKDAKPQKPVELAPVDLDAIKAKRKAEAAAARERMRQEQAEWEARQA